jgi:hypothetical protein
MSVNITLEQDAELKVKVGLFVTGKLSRDELISLIDTLSGVAQVMKDWEFAVQLCRVFDGDLIDAQATEIQHDNSTK